MSNLFDQASLICTPNGYKAGKLYSIKPDTGAGDLDVVRATSATRVNSAGLIEIPATNLCLQSDMFANGIWGKSNSSVIANTTISPSGVQDADTYLGNGVSTFHLLNQAINVVSGTTYTLSIYAKKNTNNFIQILGGDASFGNTQFANFDIDNGVVGSVGSGATAIIQNVGNGWYRCSITITATATVTGLYILNLITSATSARLETNTLSTSVYLWGAQIEKGITATEYIPTTSVIRTRFAGITQDGGSASNIPRLDYTNASCPSILVEPQRTNLIFASEDFTSYTKNTTTIIQNCIVSPDGNFTGSKIYPNSSGNARGLQKNINITLNNHSLSIFAKHDGGTIDILTFTRGSAPDISFNIKTGQVVGTVPSGMTANIVPYKDGWYRCDVYYGFANTDTRFYIFLSNTPNSFSVTANGTDGIFIWGTQVEQGSNATSYIPTVASAMTRNVDVISKSGVSSLIGQTEGSIYCEFISNGINSNVQIFTLSDGTTNERIALRHVVLPNNFLNFTIRTLGVFVVNLNASIAIAGQKYKMCATYNQTEQKLFVNGVLVVTRIGSYQQPLPLNTVQLGGVAGNQFISNTSFNSALVFTNVLSDAEAIQLTTL